MERTAHSLEPAGPLREVDLPETDLLLRDDVRRLGALVGEMLAEQVGEDFLAEVERVRVTAIRRREANAPVDELATLLQGHELSHAERLVRAFSSYFQAVNLAERVHRIRRRRDYQRSDTAPQPGGLEDALRALREAGVSAGALSELLARLHIEPVFTAHPTEAVRRTLLEKERIIVRLLIDDIDRGLTPQERQAALGRIRQTLSVAWQTEETPPERPTVQDEFEHVGFYLTDVLYPLLPVFHEDFAAALLAVYGDAVPAGLPGTLLRFGSWVGGDMDGNPLVGANTIRQTLAGQRRLVLEAYGRDVERLARLLTQSLTRVGFAPALLEQLQRYRIRFGTQSDTARQADMPYRNFLQLVARRLADTAADGRQAYSGVEEFRADVALVDASLCAHGGRQAGHFSVQRLLRRIDAFGFHLATLDLRQDASVHAAALAGPEDPDAVTTLAVFRTVAELLPRFGAQAFGPYIISMSRTADDVLAVLALARRAGCIDEQGQVPLDVAPLFETIDDLAGGAAVLRELLADPGYRRHLAARGDRQIVMLGYSDSAKDGGIAAARWALQQAQVSLTALAQATGIHIRFFHGRGGSLARGGGKTERAVIAAPRGSVDGYLRLTEQGEVIHRKYGIRAIALRNLEQATGAVLRATLCPRRPEAREAGWRTLAATVARDSMACYRALVCEHEAFVDYFRTVTPIDAIEHLRIGSRPSRRQSGGGIASLRAIPWVFAWSQNRAGLVAWYGVGSALDAAIARYGIDALQEMARDWPFFATLIDDVEMVLAKSDMAIFARYSQLSPAHGTFYPGIAAEFARTRAAILALRGTTELLAGDRRLRLSIRLRNPYVDPISLLQVDLLERWRTAGRPAEGPLFHALVATVNGIAAGVQNTG